jgi:F0F1-type ATP synthase alpha subunit
LGILLQNLCFFTLPIKQRSDLDESTKQLLVRGSVLTELLKQRQYEPMKTLHQVVILFTGVEGYLDSLEKEEINRLIFFFFNKNYAHGSFSIFKDLKNYFYII